MREQEIKACNRDGFPFVGDHAIQQQGSNFFFSSRRRHTRFDCDWSSDVCSSDLRHRPSCRSISRRTSANGRPLANPASTDRKSTRLNSSHSQISYAVFCLKKKKKLITSVVYTYDR